MLFLFLAACGPQRERVVLATTTSVEDTGLLDTLSSAFNASHPQYILAGVAAGTGMVMEIGKRKDADVLLTHDPDGELKYVQEGFGYGRRYVMQNEFVVAGPPEDPAGIRGVNAADALRILAKRELPFVSRADDSGTHRREKRLWHQLGIEPTGDWYIPAGVGMGDALLLAGQKRAYILSDRATFMKFKPRTNLEILVSGDSVLVNLYHIMIVPGAHNEDGGKAFAAWITGPQARQIIRQFGTAQLGEPLFFIRAGLQ
ncbi:MAG TPA: substrate-binding domain-containing protein [Longimicrobiales bacterium]